MSSFKPGPTTLLLSALALSMSSTAMAKQCDEIFTEPDGDDYYQLNKTLIDKNTTQQIRSFADQLDGSKWRGTGIEVECGRSNGETLSTISNFDIDAEIRMHFLGSIILDAEKESRHKVQLEKIFITPEIEKHNQGMQVANRSYSIEFSNPNTLVFNDKYRVRNATINTTRSTPLNNSNSVSRQRSETGTRMVHEIKSVKLANNTLKISRDVYVNGHFVSNQEWQLKRAI